MGLSVCRLKLCLWFRNICYYITQQQHSKYHVYYQRNKTLTLLEHRRSKSINRLIHLEFQEESVKVLLSIDNLSRQFKTVTSEMHQMLISVGHQCI